MQNKCKILILNLLMMLTIGLGKIYAQISLTDSEVRKINKTYERLDSAQAQGRLVLIDLKKYQDSTSFWKNKAMKLRRKRNFWRKVALIETIYIGSTFIKK